MEDLTLSELMEIVERKDSRKIEEILLQFKDKWNLLMEENRKLNRKIELNDIVLVDKDLSGLDLSDATIEDSDFSGSDLTDVDLSNSSITGSRFQGSDLSGARLYGAHISQSNMSDAKLYNVSFSGVYLTGSVNLFATYIHDDSPSVEYKTSPGLTQDGFKKLEAYEHIEDEDDDEGHGYYAEELGSSMSILRQLFIRLLRIPLMVTNKHNI